MELSKGQKEGGMRGVETGTHVAKFKLVTTLMTLLRTLDRILIEKETNHNPRDPSTCDSLFANRR